MSRLKDYVIKHSTCSMPRCEYVENDIEIDCDTCQEKMLEEHDAKVREDAIDEFANEIINPSNYERFDFDDCLYSSDKVNDFFKYVYSIAKQLKEKEND